MDKNISFTLKVWRQKGPKDKGHFDRDTVAKSFSEETT